MTPDPLEPNRATAQRWAAEELLDPEYRRAEPNLLQRVAEQVLEWLQELLSRADGVSSGYGLLIGLGVLLLAIVVSLLVSGPVRRTVRRTKSTGGVFEGLQRSAEEHRRAAEAAAAAGDLARAVQERFRAVARSLEERVVLDPRPGRTADEVAREAGTALPPAAQPLMEAARAFDDVTYGGRPGTSEAYRRVVAADDAAARVRPGRQPAGTSA